MVTSQSSSEFSSLSAPTSPGRISFSSGVYFYSVPTSPKEEKTNIPFDSNSEPGVLKSSVEIDSDIDDDFEFLTVQDFESPLWDQQQQQQQQRQRGQSLPAISFADELFSNSQVLPLKLPPRLQYVDNKKYNIKQIMSPSLKSPSSVLKGPFSCLSWVNDEFDPFMAALEHVRKEEKNLGSSYRRSLSLSPLRTTSQWLNDSRGVVQEQNKQESPLKPIRHIRSIPSRSTNRKNLVSTSPFGGKRSNHRRAIKPTLTTLPWSTGKADESLTKSTRKSEGSWGSRKRKIKDFLFRSASEGRADSKDKLRSRTAALRKNPYLRKLSFKSIYAAYYNAKKGESHEMKKSLIAYRPRMFLCLGFGLKDHLN